MRSVASLTIAAIITFFLFWFMQRLILPPQQGTAPPDNYKVIQAVLAKAKPRNDRDRGYKDDKNAKPLESPKLQPLFVIDIPVPDLEGMEVKMPEMVLAPNLSTVSNWSDAIVAVGADGTAPYGFGSDGGDHHLEIIPHGTIQPKYPETAARRKLEGWVKVEFTINEGGWVGDVVILDSDPKGIFEQTTVEAVQTWKYSPIPTPIRASQYIEFKLEQLQYYQGK